MTRTMPGQTTTDTTYSVQDGERSQNNFTKRRP